MITCGPARHTYSKLFPVNILTPPKVVQANEEVLQPLQSHKSFRSLTTNTNVTHSIHIKVEQIFIGKGHIITISRLSRLELTVLPTHRTCIAVLQRTSRK